VRRPTIADRIAIRNQQIEACRDMIAWEASHDWGEAVQLAHFSANVIEDYNRLIATLELITSKLREAEE
jgi:uncharacterized membrane protein YccC